MTQIRMETDVAVRILQEPVGRWQKLLVMIVVSALGTALVLPFPMTGRGWSALFNFAHAPAFFLTFVIIVLLIDPTVVGFDGRFSPLFRLTKPRLILLSEILIAVGIACELAQKFVGRHVSYGDIIANTAGLAAGAMFCFARQCRSSSARRALIVSSIFVLLAPCWEPVRELNECLRQRLEFPLLASFERTQELKAWAPHGSEVTLDSTWFSVGERSMRVEALSTEYPGNLMVWPMADWRKFSTLCVDVYNPGDSEIHVGINIGDALHYKSGFSPDDRFGSSYRVRPRETVTAEISLREVSEAPRGRKMVMSHVTHVDVYLVEASRGIVFHIDNIRLSSSEAASR